MTDIVLVGAGAMLVLKIKTMLDDDLRPEYTSSNLRNGHPFHESKS